MILESILLAIACGWLLGGKFMRLADVKIRHGWLIFAAFGIYVTTLICNYTRALPEESTVYSVANAVEFIAIMVMAAANRRIPGAWIVFAGLLTNIIAITANGGVMPTSIDGIRSAFGPRMVEYALSTPNVRHAFIDAGTRLRIICDVIPVRRPYFLIPAVYSIGDVITSIGGMIAIVAIMRTPQKPKERSASES